MATVANGNEAIFHSRPRRHTVAAAIFLCFSGCFAETRLAHFEDARNRELDQRVNADIEVAARHYPDLHSERNVDDSTIHTLSIHRGCSGRFVVETVSARLGVKAG